jgi:Protein of unknown function (DUF2891)
MRSSVLLTVLMALSCTAHAAAESSSLDPAAAARFAGLALKCLHDEYPNHVSTTMDSDADALPPHKLTPSFYGCFDWHSDVHGHWLLVRMLRIISGAPMQAAPFAAQARAELARSFTAENIAGEVAYFRREGRASFERPYGLAWLLKLLARHLRGLSDHKGW